MNLLIWDFVSVRLSANVHFYGVVEVTLGVVKEGPEAAHVGSPLEHGNIEIDLVEFLRRRETTDAHWVSIEVDHA
ncbi:hypothetical protein ColTof3_08985 [Colletotrichum tofieldiae]|nr:hypothetical protein ColTof3_08985 [Colletotrichum tofieldiae]